MPKIHRGEFSTEPRGVGMDGSEEFGFCVLRLENVWVWDQSVHFWECLNGLGTITCISGSV